MRDKDEITDIELFDLYQFHERIMSVSRDLFANGHFEQSVTEAFKAVENAVKEKSGRIDLYGQDLMAQVFNENGPILQLNDMKTLSERDEQIGFKFIFMGVLRGIRNPRAHENIQGGQGKIALEYLSLASLLMRRIDLSTLTMHAEEMIRCVKQETFVKKTGYVAAILDRISPQLYVKCAEKLIQLYLDDTEAPEIHENAYYLYQIIIQRFDEPKTKLITQTVSELCDNDDTFVKGITLLQENQVQWLDQHIAEKVFGNLISDLENGTEDRDVITGSKYWTEVVRLRRSIQEHLLLEICEVIQRKLKGGNWFSQTFATRIMHNLKDVIPEPAVPGIMDGLLFALIWNKSFGARDHVSKQIESYPESWIRSFVETLINAKGNDEDRLHWLEEALECSKLQDDLVVKISSEIVKLNPRKENEIDTPF